jgi:hypothetical protein
MRLLAGGFGACALLLAAQHSELGAAAGPAVASVAAIADALRAEKALGYDLRATSNEARLMAEVLLRLARAAHATDSDRAAFCGHSGGIHRRIH